MPNTSEHGTRAEAQRKFTELMARLRSMAEAETRREIAARIELKREMEEIGHAVKKLEEQYRPLVPQDAQDLIDEYERTLNNMGGAIVRNLRP